MFFYFNMAVEQITGIITQVYQENGRCYADLLVCSSDVFNKDNATKITGFPISFECYRDYFDEVEASRQDNAEKDVIVMGELEVSLEEKPPWE